MSRRTAILIAVAFVLLSISAMIVDYNASTSDVNKVMQEQFKQNGIEIEETKEFSEEELRASHFSELEIERYLFAIHLKNHRLRYLFIVLVFAVLIFYALRVFYPDQTSDGQSLSQGSEQ